MRTTLDIPDELIDAALEASRLPTTRDAIIAGLKELIRKSRRDELRRSAGSGELSLDLMQSRKRKR